MTSRRDFLKKAAMATAALSVGQLASGLTTVRGNRVSGASDLIRVGVFGVNSRGLALASSFAKMPLCEVTCLCDCDANALERCQAQIYKQTGKMPKGFRDIRKMMEWKDFDVAVIAMPDHWHAAAGVMALQAGKHVYLEKPTSYCPAENELLLKAAAVSGKVITAGNQRRSWPNVIAAINAVKDGTIGEVRYAKSWYSINRPSIGRGKEVPVPAHLDWDLWQGPAPRRPFHDNYVHYNWHWFHHWGTGEALNNGTHFVDILRWGLGVDYPTLVTSVGGRFRYEDDWEFPDTQMITFQFGDRAAGSWEGRSCNSTPTDGFGVGVAFYGENGTVLLGGGNEYKLLDMKGEVIRHVSSADLTFEPGNLVNPSEKLDQIHFQNFFDAIRLGTRLNSDILNACISTQLVQLGNIAQRTGTALHIDPSTGRIIGNPEAQKLWARDYEPGWEIRI